MFNPKTIRKDFPIFGNFEKEEGRPLVYLDSSASSQTPQSVIDAMNGYYTEFRSNIDRGTGKLSSRATNTFEEARALTAKFINCSPEEIIFTHGSTDAANIVVRMLAQKLRLGPGDRIVTTIADHHSNLLPLQILAKETGAELVFAGLTPNNDLDYEEAENLINQKTKIVSVPLASNVLGTVFDVGRLAHKAFRSGALVLVDATAAAGHIRIDVKELSADALYFGAHKMCGPTGVGVLYVRKELLEKMEPVTYGGGAIMHVTKDDVTWRKDVKRFEPGTPNIAGVIGFGEALRYLESLGINIIKTYLQDIVKYAIDELKKIPGVILYAEQDPRNNVGIVSFTVKGIHPHDLAEILSRDGIVIRTGHHCAEPLMEALGQTALARASFYLYNNREDVDALVAGIKKSKEIFGLIR